MGALVAALRAMRRERKKKLSKKVVAMFVNLHALARVLLKDDDAKFELDE